MADRLDPGWVPFAMVPRWVLASTLSDRALRAYAAIATFISSNGDRVAWPARKTIATRMGGCSIDKVDRAINELVDAGMLERQPRTTDDGGNASNLYRLIWEDPSRKSAAEPPPQDRGPEVDQSRSRSTDTSTASGARRPRTKTERDLLFDALVAAFGPASTKSRASFYARTVTELVAARATPEQVAHAREAMRRRGWENPSPTALVQHWDSLIAERPARARPTNPAADRFWEDR